MRPSKTQAQKKAEHAERAAALAAEREAEKRERDEYMKQQAIQAAALKAAQQDKKKDKKKGPASRSASAAASTTLLPSAAEVAHMGEHGRSENAGAHGPSAAGAADADADAAESNAAFAAAAAAELSSLQLSSSSSGSNGTGPALASPSSSSSARLVLNHSTHISGLLPFMVRLQKSPLVKTILPGAISSHGGPAIGDSSAPHLSVVYQSDSNDGAWNFVAKHGSSRQDLRITPKLKIVKRSMLEEAISDILNPAHRELPVESHSSASASDGLLAPNANRVVAQMAAKEHRQKDQAKHAAIKDKETAAAHAKKVAEKAKRLKAAIGQKNESVQAYAEEWVKWEK